jgi:hypothetical protein
MPVDLGLDLSAATSQSDAVAANTAAIAANTAAIALLTASARGFRGQGNAGADATGADYPFVLDDAGKCVNMNKATAQTATAPLNATVAFVAWQDVVSLRQAGAGAFTLTPVSGAVTIVPPPGKTLVSNGVGSIVSLLYIGANTWQAYGDLVPS